MYIEKRGRERKRAREEDGQVTEAGQREAGSLTYISMLYMLYHEEPGWTPADRFGPMDDKMMTQQIYKSYAISAGVKVEYYDEHGQENLSRHPLSRCQDAMLRLYAEAIRRNGIAGGPLRGSVMQQSKEARRRLHKLHMITNGTLTQALYKVYQTDPTNRLVWASIDAGLVNCVILHQDTPSDVVHFLMNRSDDIDKSTITDAAALDRRRRELIFRHNSEWRPTQA